MMSKNRRRSGASNNNYVTVTTASGFTCSINRAALDDWEFAKAAAGAADDAGNGLRLTVYMVEHMMSAKDSARLKEHIKTPDGRVPASRMIAEVQDIFERIGEKKS